MPMFRLYNADEKPGKRRAVLSSADREDCFDYMLTKCTTGRWFVRGDGIDSDIYNADQGRYEDD